MPVDLFYGEEPASRLRDDLTQAQIFGALVVAALDAEAARISGSEGPERLPLIDVAQRTGVAVVIRAIRGEEQREIRDLEPVLAELLDDARLRGLLLSWLAGEVSLGAALLKGPVGTG